MSRPASRVEALLEELCVRRGHSLSREKVEAIAADPPSDAEAFVDVVLQAKGLEPGLVDKRTRGALMETVSQWLFDGGTGKGSRSG